MEQRFYGDRPRRGGFDNGGRSPPVREGEELDVQIEAIGEKGDGVAKKDGFVLFVPNVQQGQNVRIKVTRVLRKVGFGEVIGEAQSAPAAASEESSDDSSDDTPAEAEPEYSEENDSEDFGEESSDESGDAPAEDEEKQE